MSGLSNNWFKQGPIHYLVMCMMKWDCDKYRRGAGRTGAGENAGAGGMVWG